MYVCTFSRNTVKRKACARHTTNAVSPIYKVLIANRGEIACRVIKTAKRLGISTLAVYSDADANAMHVKMADEAVRLGPAEATESYLKGDYIIEVAKQAGAQAIHPGYGFLSENAGFATKLEENGLVFIGPPASAITAMGSKSASKIIMEAAGVPCVPGYHGEDQSVEKFKEEARRIGYPVIFKAVLGGGGKGMRIVDDESEVVSAIESCRREALKSFGDDRILVEKYLRRPRHVEIQVFADKLGNCVYLFERDCSVQRRHQKIIEEAPAPGLSPELRKQIGESAVAAARAVGYVGAGTVEFIVSENFEFYFMEMNTRLQVEHPVTEMITKEDLVEWQLRVAMGLPLPKTQEELQVHGHAFEARIYAENPRNDFLPGTGKLELLSTPQETNNVRVDTGVREGDSVSIFYDPMIAKLIVWDSDRSSALRKLTRALKDYKIAPLETNIEFLIDLANHPEFEAANVHTGFIQDHYNTLFPPNAPPEDVLAVIGLAISQRERQQQIIKSKESEDPFSPWGLADGYRIHGQYQQEHHLLVGDTSYKITITYNSDGTYDTDLVTEKAAGTSHSGSPRSHRFSSARLTLDGRNIDAHINGRNIRAQILFTQNADSIHVLCEGKHWTVQKTQVEFKEFGVKGDQGEVTVKSPMPGKIVKTLVTVGAHVIAGQDLLILEAMKMEHKIKSKSNGVVTHIKESGSQVAPNAALVTIQTKAHLEE